jgi:hypothetical protein
MNDRQAFWWKTAALVVLISIYVITLRLRRLLGGLHAGGACTFASLGADSAHPLRGFAAGNAGCDILQTTISPWAPW